MAPFSDIDPMIEDFIQRERIPGLALVILRGDEVIVARGYGVTSVEDGGIPVTPQTLFRIGSVSKPLAGTAIMRLVERGQLDLDMPISHYLNWLAFNEPGAAERITPVCSCRIALAFRKIPRQAHATVMEVLEVMVSSAMSASNCRRAALWLPRACSFRTAISASTWLAIWRRS